jgi:dihydrofolate reductase
MLKRTTNNIRMSQFPYVNIIAAVNKNGVIGKNNRIPWTNKEDQLFFRNMTMGSPILMGWNTFESILSYRNKPLSGRKHIVITQNHIFYTKPMKNVEYYTSIGDYLSTTRDKEIFVIGGETIYTSFLTSFIDHVKTVNLSIIPNEMDGDTFFPMDKLTQFKKVKCFKHSTFESKHYHN